MRQLLVAPRQFGGIGISFFTAIASKEGGSTLKSASGAGMVPREFDFRRGFRLLRLRVCRIGIWGKASLNSARNTLLAVIQKQANHLGSSMDVAQIEYRNGRLRLRHFQDPSHLDVWNGRRDGRDPEPFGPSV